MNTQIKNRNSGRTVLAVTLATAMCVAATASFAQPRPQGLGGPPMHSGWQSQVPQAQVGAMLSQRGFGPVLGMGHSKHHLEVYTTRQGTPIEVKLNPDGSFHEWSIPKHARYQMPANASSAANPVAIAAAAGYRDARIGEYKRNHVEVFASNRDGEAVELHIDPQGRIYKEKLSYGWFGEPRRGGGRPGR